jgi:hypothetical protein
MQAQADFSAHGHLAHIGNISNIHATMVRTTYFNKY